MARKPIQKPEINFKTFGNMIKQRRESMKLKQEEAAQLAGISRGYWSQIENGETKKRLRRETVLKIAGAINARPEQALPKMGYAVEDLERVYGPEASADKKLNKALKNFTEILLTTASETEAAFHLMLIYREYHNRNLGKEYAQGPDPIGYQSKLRDLMVMTNYERWLLVRAILLLMEQRPKSLICFPNTPENEQFNKEQRRLLRLAASMKERQMELTQRYEGDRRAKKKKP